MMISANALFQTDCLALLERIESEQVMVAFIDPPPFPSIQTPSSLTDNRDKDEKLRRLEDEEMKRLREYLSFLSKVLQQVERVLSKHGNLFFQTEHHLTGDIRLILNQTFGRKNFLSEIIWPRRTINANSVKLKVEHDTIFHYSKSDSFIYNRPFKPKPEKFDRTAFDAHGVFEFMDITLPISSPSLQFKWKGVALPPGRSWRYTKEQLDELDKAGRIYHRSEGKLPKMKVYLDLAERQGVEVGSVWDDILPLAARSSEYLSFPTQKPLALLDRIIQIGSNPGDVVLDPCCGSGTTLAAAQACNRKWLGCDISLEAYSLSLKRLEDMFKLHSNEHFIAGDQSFLEKKFPVIYGLYNAVGYGLDDLKQLARAKFVHNNPVTVEETRQYEFKEITGSNPVNRIKDVTERYAVAFLNSGGGRIYWGIRDFDRVVVGVPLNYRQRDELRRVVTEKLTKIQPAIAPTAFRIEFHQVYEDDNAVPDVYVVEIAVPTVSSKTLYFTSSGKAVVRTDGGTKELDVLQLQDEILRRHLN